jgi:DNA-binding NarL/FixJ family response regulator
MRVSNQQMRDFASAEEPPAAPSDATNPLSVKPSDTIIVIDSNLLSRDCLARVIAEERRVSVECYSNIEQLIASGESRTPSLVVLCQTGRNKADAIAEVERLTQASAQIGNCPTVVLSDNEDPDIIVEMLGKNIRGYVPTSLSISIALHAMDLARAGGVFVPASSLVAAHSSPEASATAPKGSSLFTARQAAVVEALRRGKANKIIAYELKMRESTVKVHVRNIMKKLHATNRTEVAFIAGRLLNGEEIAG